MNINFFVSTLTSYIKGHIKVILAFMGFILIFTILFWLQNIPLNSIFYGLILIISMALIFFVFDFVKFYYTHNELLSLMNTINVNFNKLPKPNNLLESDYQVLINEIHNNMIVLSSQFDSKYSEMMDYYTLWVHQIKTPISAIHVLLQRNSDLNTSELSQELFKIERYVEMALEYIRLGSITLDLEFKKYSLLNIVKQALKKYASVFIHKKIILNLEEFDYMVLTDKKWLLFVIEQILSNALKYTNVGSISIYMDKSKDNTLVIEDTGIGIQSEDIPRIFERGFTGYNGRMDKKSTGLGLYLVKETLNKLSHKVTIESIVEKGTSVKIDFSTIETFKE